MHSPGVVWIDHDERQHEYRRLRLPGNWDIHLANEWGSIGASLRWALDRYPDASHYGWLADDTIPRTRGWDRKLEAAADNGNLAYARDLWLSENDEELRALQQGRDLSSGLCWGGDLVRAAGWWALPGLTQAGIDTAWVAIISRLRRGRYLADVVVEHLHYKAGKRTDEGWSDHQLSHISRDIQTRNDWVNSADYIETLERIARECPQRTHWPEVCFHEEETLAELHELGRQREKQRIFYEQEARKSAVPPPLARRIR